MKGRSMAWTEERIALLTQYWQEGRSASQIAEALGENLTRNAVIGKAHRLGLAQRPSPVKAAEGKGPVTRAQRPARTAEPKPAARAVAPVAAPEPVVDAPRVAAPAPVPAPVTPAGNAAASAPGSPPGSPLAPAPAAPAPARKATGRGAKAARVTLLDLNDRICKWPIGHPDEPDFHFCGKPVNPGFPYCAEHCMVAYQSQLPRRDRPAGPPPPFRPNLPRVR
jgi:GcrA cell cycle regulator